MIHKKVFKSIMVYEKELDYAQAKSKIDILKKNYWLT